MCKVSMICPVYNASGYLSRSVGSMLDQTFKDFELILVDDGSTDDSGAVCDSLASKDNRIKVVHKTNGGVASARQAGLDVTVGEYIGHLDPDDWIDSRFLERMLQVAEDTNADMVSCPICTFTSEKSRKVTRPSARAGIMNSLCNKLIRKSVYEKYGLCFPVSLTAAEDAFVVFSARIKGVLTAECDDVFYYYDRYSNAGSLTRTKLDRSLSSIRTCISLLEDVDGDEREKKRLLTWMKEVAKVKAFYILPSKEYISLYKEVNCGFVARNLLKVTRVEAYAALAIVIRNSEAAMRLFQRLKSLTHRQD